MKRRQVLLSDAWSEVEKNPEGSNTKKRTINCNTTCSIGKIAQQETTCVPVAQVTDASVNLDSAATISDHDTTGLLECSAVCCSNEMEAYQPKQKAIFQQISKNGRYFTCSWYEKYSWITLCLTKKKVFCYCRYCHKFLQAANKCDYAFTTRGFDNIKKACDRLIQELHDRFGQREVMKPCTELLP